MNEKSSKKSTFTFRLFPKKGPKENIFQYILRQFLLSDSYGKPSWTITILVYTLGLVAFVAFIESKVALTTQTIYDVNSGKVISQGAKGFSSEFLYLVIGLSVIITAFFQSRSVKQAKEESQKETSITQVPENNAAIDIAKEASPQMGTTAGVLNKILSVGKNLIGKVVK